MRKFLILLVILCAVFMTACGEEEKSSGVKREQSGSKVTNAPDEKDPSGTPKPGDNDPTPEPTKPASTEFTGHYSNNLYATGGRLVEDEGCTFLLDKDERGQKQCLYSISDSADAKPVLLMEIPTYNEGGYMIPLEYYGMVGYGNMLYLLDGHDRDNTVIYYCAKDGKSQGKFGNIPGIVAVEGASSVGSKMYYVSYPYRDYFDERLGDCADRITLYEVDFEKKTINPVSMSVKLGELEHIRIAGVTSEAVYYVLCGKFDSDLKGFYRYDLASGASKEILKKKSEDLGALTLAGHYILFEDDHDIYSVDVLTGELYRIATDVSLRSEAHVVDDVVYYLLDEVELFSCDIHGDNRKRVASKAPGTHNDKKTLGTSGDWFYYTVDDSFYRMKRDSSTFPSEEQTLVVPEKPVLQVNEGVFVPDTSIFGQTIAQLNQYFGSIPTPETWEWEGGYDSYTDIYFNGDKYTLFFTRNKLHAVRFEFYSYDIPRYLVEEYTARYGSYQMRTDSYGNVISTGINGYGYRFRTDFGYLDLFYNYYDEEPHTAIHFSLY